MRALVNTRITEVSFSTPRFFYFVVSPDICFTGHKFFLTFPKIYYYKPSITFYNKLFFFLSITLDVLTLTPYCLRKCHFRHYIAFLLAKSSEAHQMRFFVWFLFAHFCLKV